MPINPKFRLYSFVNGLYMSPIQHGIQTAHLVGEMAVKNTMIFQEWAQYDKTIVILNAGNHKGLYDIYEVLEEYRHDFPVGIFHEDVESLGGIITCVGIILPQQYYNVTYDSNFNEWVYDDGESERRYGENHRFFKLISMMKNLRLA